MITASVNDKDELVITGKMEIGDKIKGLCCKGYDCEVLSTFQIDDNDPKTITIWYGCESPKCPNSHVDGYEFDPYAGIDSIMIEDLADWIMNNKNKDGRIVVLAMALSTIFMVFAICGVVDFARMVWAAVVN